MNKILIINANYYKSVSKNLILGVQKKIKNHQIKSSIIDVPGVFEIPYIIKKYIKEFDAFIALGCVIKGETPHFDFISKSTFNAIITISVDQGKPIGNGIITSLNMKQAIERSAIGKNSLKPNKGFEAANAVISVLKNKPQSI